MRECAHEGTPLRVRTAIDTPQKIHVHGHIFLTEIVLRMNRPIRNWDGR